MKSLYITGPEHTVNDLLTIEDCNLALQHLVIVVRETKASLMIHGPTANTDWIQRAKCALYLREQAIFAVNRKRKELRLIQDQRWELRFLETIREVNRPVYEEVLTAMAA